MANLLFDNKEQKRFEFQLKGGVPFIDYILTRNKIYLTHTEVPKALEGKGVGSALILAALEDIEKRELALVPLCPFVAAYIKRHPEWKKLVLKGINIE